MKGRNVFKTAVIATIIFQAVLGTLLSLVTNMNFVEKIIRDPQGFLGILAMTYIGFLIVFGITNAIGKTERTIQNANKFFEQQNAKNEEKEI